VDLHTKIQLQFGATMLISNNQDQMTNKMDIFNKSQSKNIENWCCHKIQIHKWSKIQKKQNAGLKRSI